MSRPKTHILTTLMQGDWISGQALANAAGISRTAIWKHIHTLRQEGYPIQASSGRGYRMEYIPDRLGSEAVHAGLQTVTLGRNIVFHPQIDSTQNQAKILGEQGALEGTVVLAESQTQGRGRRGRTWTAIPHGMAMSVILRPDLPPDQAPHFPLLAGVAVGRAISRACNLSPGLKWPNDILISGMKVVGILAELDAEMDRINAVYLGIGLNVNATLQDMPPELTSTATSLRIQSGREINRLHLVRTVLEELESAYFTYQARGFAPIRQAWKDQSITLGHNVRITSGRTFLTGTALDMLETGALLIRTADNSEVAITAGEVQLCSEV
ncbi:MAG: biotin--[acetyl-CoA-carboxylase] ligase [Desulfovermiculus sp.]|nr:biotin--[acetyl-CoA-carboxylase] ligase [Desulfovermiculus sp.]